MFDRKAALLKEEIIEKFGSVRAFAIHKDQTLCKWTIIRALRCEVKKDLNSVLNEISKNINKLNPDKKKISEGQRELIRRTILIHFRSASKFCETYQQFSKTFVSDILRGKKTLYDDRTKNLFEIIVEFTSKN